MAFRKSTVVAAAAVALLASAHAPTCADGAVWAWGLNDSGRLGDGTTTQRLVPLRVPNLSGANGWAGLTWDVPTDEPSGAHTATAALAGDVWYEPASVNTAFNVVP